jgi:1-acyl-sn-glycerol-3-phosphate acyltransferase
MKYLKGIIASIILVLNTVILVSTLLLFSLGKLIVPLKKFRIFVSLILVWIAETWIYINSATIRLIHGEKIQLEQMPELSSDQWYLVIANHQSTADIPIIQSVFNKKIPFLKFFLKQELIWVPFLGLAWWALDFPFMKRYSKQYLAKNPQLIGKDMEQTQKSCAKFKYFPTSVINFIEGTRFSVAKHQQQSSPYKHLLKPKAGGLGVVLGSMGNQLKQVLLVTLVYQKHVPTLWQYLCGDYVQVRINCEKIVIPDALLNKNYQTDEKFKTELFKWSENLWYKQDTKLNDIYERTDI